MAVWNPKLLTPEYRPADTAWLRHGPFAMWLVQALKPRRIVELGSHSGYSYFCFCQAVEAAELKTECFAVDTWEGDEHAGFYDENVFEIVQRENSRYETFSTLLQKTFKDALQDIEDGTVDLLHVDGRHHYEDVKTDFESWIPKLSSRAVVLFHDTEVRERNFGVWRYWAEISRDRPSLNFPYQHGLGVLFWGADVADGIKPIVKKIEDDTERELLIDHFSTHGENLQLQQDLNSVQQELDSTSDDIIQLHQDLNSVQQELDSTSDDIIQLHQDLNSVQQELDSTSDDIIQLHQDLEEKEAELSWEREEAAGLVSRMQHELVDARRRPFKQLKRKLVHKLLRALSKASPPLSSRTAARFASSAAKRDPRRSDAVVKRGYSKGRYDYDTVLSEWQEQRSAIAEELSELVEQLSNGVLISIIVPVYNPDPSLLAEMIESICAQSYGNWELCIADDASTEPEVLRILKEYASSDSRIRIVFRPENGHISKATNSAIEIAQGDFLAFVDHDDLLDPDALLLIAKVIDTHREAKIIYSDEDKVRLDGSRYDPHFKPDWNRELLYGYNYVSHLGVYDANMVRQAGLLRPDYEGAQDYDLLLRCIDIAKDDEIHHIPKVLYSWRASPGSTAESSEAKPYATEAGRLALEDHLGRQWGAPIKVEPGRVPFTYRPIWPVNIEQLVSIIIPTRDHLGILRKAVESILKKTNYDNFEIIIVDNGSVEAETLAWFDEIKKSDPRVRIIQDQRPFNYSALNNNAVEQSKGEFVALVNNDIEVINSNWLTEMVSLAQRQDVGCVGAKLYYPDGRIQHAGVVIGIGGVAGHGQVLCPGSAPGYFTRLYLRQQFSAVTAACLLVRRGIFDEVGGLNEIDLSIAFNDVDFCLKVAKAGYKNLWTPHAELVHHESVSRGYEDSPKKVERFGKEVSYMKRVWHTDTYKDPSYNHNLSLENTNFELAKPHWELDS